MFEHRYPQRTTPFDPLLDDAKSTGTRLLRVLALALAAVLLAALLGGCATARAGDRAAIREQVVARVKGTPVDLFFVVNGPPQNKYVTESGMAVYHWTTHPPGTLPLSRPLCAINLTADAKGTITDVRILSDAVGFRRASACDEVIR